LSRPNADEPGGSRPRFLTVEQVAEQLNVGVPLVRSLLKTGELRGIQIGGRGMWRVAAKDLGDYIEQAYRVTAERIDAGEVPDHELTATSDEG
jgi:prophage regulatory protein